MTERTPHPDFLAAPEEARWAGTLPALAEKLKHEAYAAKGGWAWRILPGGALVAMCVPPSFRKELRIARRLRKAFSDRSAAAWHLETRTFLEQFGFKGWVCKRDGLVEPTKEGEQQMKIEAVYQEPAPLGAKTAPAEKCARCEQEFEVHPNDKVYRELLCTKCATALGREEAEARGH
jgi:hypothetical protein